MPPVSHCAQARGTMSGASVVTWGSLPLVATWLKAATVTFDRSAWPMAAGSITGGHATPIGAASPESAGAPASTGPMAWPPPHPQGNQIANATVARAVHHARVAGQPNLRNGRAGAPNRPIDFPV